MNVLSRFLVLLLPPLLAWPVAVHAAEAPGEPGAELKEVVVTARRRSELLQRTPISVVALSRAELETRSIGHLRGLHYQVPNLTLAPSQNVGDAAGNAFIRGIGQEDFIAGTEPGVGVYLDDVYLARSSGTLMQLLDVARIEVLRGPQGTLFGKNTIGGAIRIIGEAPERQPAARASVTVGNFHRTELKATINEPINDRWLMRASAGLSDRDGYLQRLPPPNAAPALPGGDRRAEGDEHAWAGRGQLRWLSGESLFIEVSADVSRRHSRQAALHVDEVNALAGPVTVINRLIASGSLPGPAFDARAAPADLLQSHAGGEGFIRQEAGGLSAQLQHDFGRQSLNAVAAYRSFRNHIVTDSDGWPLSILRNEFNENQRQYSVELRWSGTLERLQWHVGLFALDERTDTRPSPGVGLNEVLYTCGCYYSSFPGAVTTRRRLANRSEALFAQLRGRITRQLSLSLGGRRTHEAKSIDAEMLALDPALRPTSTVVAMGSNRDAWNSVTYSAAVEFQATPTLMAYASTAQGYKSGGFNVRPSVALQNLGLYAFAPETALTAELGLRSGWWRRRLRVNATLFQTNYRDIQLRHQTLASGLLVTLIGNAARARIRGLELDVVLAPAAGLEAGARYGHLDARYLDVGTAPEITLASRFQRTPIDAKTAWLDYRLPTAGGEIQLHVDYAWRAREQFQLTASPYDQQAYGVYDARIAFHPARGRWQLALFGTNLADERFRAAGRYSTLSQFGVATSIVGMPRQVGVQLEVSR